MRGNMRKSNWKIQLLHLLGMVAMALAIGNAVLYSSNRQLQAEVNTRAQYMQQTVQLQALYQTIVKALAELALKDNDVQLLQVLAAQGISVTPNRVAQPEPAAPVVVAPKR